MTEPGAVYGPGHETVALDAACPRCGHVGRVTVWEGANASRYPELVGELLAGRLNVVPCGACGTPFGIERELLWTQLDRGWYVSVYPRRDFVRLDAIVPLVEGAFDAAVANAPVAVQMRLRAVRRRLVFGLDELREKVLCIEHGIDDTDLEMTKIAEIGRHPEWCAVPGMTGLVLADVDPGHLVFRYADADDPERVVAVPRSSLDAVHEARPEWATEVYFPPPYVHVSTCTALL